MLNGRWLTSNGKIAAIFVEEVCRLIKYEGDFGNVLEELACSEVTPQLSASRGNSFCLRSIEATVGDYQGMYPIAFRLQRLEPCILE